jgi:hypothetical protein
MKFKSATLIAVFLSCVSFNVSAQKWADAIESQQNKVRHLQTQVFASTQKILELDAQKGLGLGLNYDIQNSISDQLQAVSSELLNLQTQQMLFEMITNKTLISNAQKLMKVRQNQLIKELSFRADNLQRQSRIAKDNETTRFIFEARDLIKSSSTLSLRSNASVLSSSEYPKIPIASNFAALMKLARSSKSAWVSPGNPTIKFERIPASGDNARI